MLLQHCQERIPCLTVTKLCCKFLHIDFFFFLITFKSRSSLQLSLTAHLLTFSTKLTLNESCVNSEVEVSLWLNLYFVLGSSLQFLHAQYYQNNCLWINFIPGPLPSARSALFLKLHKLLWLFLSVRNLTLQIHCMLTFRTEVGKKLCLSSRYLFISLESYCTFGGHTFQLSVSGKLNRFFPPVCANS